jgi:hypothetical protein
MGSRLSAEPPVLPSAESLARRLVQPSADPSAQGFIDPSEPVANWPHEPPLIYISSENARHSCYLRVLQRLFGARRARMRELVLGRSPILFLMIEEAFVLYAVICVMRGLSGCRTVGLLHRPVPIATSGRLGYRVRRLVLRWLKHIEGCQTLTVLPFSVVPGFSAIATGWIYDFQLWDISAEERAAVEALRGERRPGNRVVLTAIGTQSRRKGFDFFADAFTRCHSLRARFHFISCGTVLPSLANYAAAFRDAGGVSVDRVISDAELLGSYAASDAVWCFYPPAGDHASGVLGRAAQLGIPVVVRQGSLSHRLCLVENIPHVSFAADGIADRLAASLPSCDARAGRSLAQRFARQSEATLRAALGLPASGVETPAST